jgi:uncharacterized integral membrane protein
MILCGAIVVALGWATWGLPAALSVLGAYLLGIVVGQEDGREMESRRNACRKVAQGLPLGSEDRKFWEQMAGDW